jgi:hypothetical protein
MLLFQADARSYNYGHSYGGSSKVRFFSTLLSRGKTFTPALIAFVALGAQSAFAAATGIAPIDAGQAAIVQVVQGLAAFAAIFLLGVLVWDFVQHRNIARSIFEFLGVVLLGLIAVNAQAVAGIFAVNGAML